MKKFLTLFFVLFFNLVLFADEPLYTFAGRVSQVIDGNTFKITSYDSSDPRNITISTVRLYGVDAPEIGQDYGIEAKEALERTVLQEIAVVEVYGVDKYKRLLGIVYHKSKLNINATMIAMGFAWHYAKYDKSRFRKDFEKFHENAKNNKLRLWAGKNVISPEEFRKQEKQRKLDDKKRLETAKQKVIDME
jgi:endonuclease YncB( thermonuclease family)